MDKTYEYIRKAQNGDNGAKELLVRENSGLIWSIVKRFYGRGEPEDLYQIGAIGLLKCIEKFDFQYDVKFSTYAVPMIIGEIRRYLRDDGAIKICWSLNELAFRAKILQEKYLKEENRELSVMELSEMLNVEKEQLILALEAVKEVQSLNEKQGKERGEGAYQLIDRIGDSNENEKMIEHISLQYALEHLDQKERQIIVMRYFHDRTQSDVAKCIGISQVQVSRIEKRILMQMKEILK